MCVCIQHLCFCSPSPSLVVESAPRSLSLCVLKSNIKKLAVSRRALSCAWNIQIMSALPSKGCGFFALHARVAASAGEESACRMMHSPPPLHVKPLVTHGEKEETARTERKRCICQAAPRGRLQKMRCTRQHNKFLVLPKQCWESSFYLFI